MDYAALDSHTHLFASKSATATAAASVILILSLLVILTGRSQALTRIGGVVFDVAFWVGTIGVVRWLLNLNRSSARIYWGRLCWSLKGSG